MVPPNDDTTGLLWEGRPPSRRGPSATLSVDAIARAGVTIADEHGLDAVTMQAVAESLSFTKMSLYRHLRSKDELLAVMIELAVEDVPDLDPRDSWRRRLETFASALADVWSRHPWLPWATRGRRVMGPREVAWTECALEPLAETRLTPAERLDAVVLISGHLRNTQSTVGGGTQPWHDPAMAEFLEDHADRFPALSDLASTELSDDNGRTFGLERILDGIQSLHEARGARA